MITRRTAALHLRGRVAPLDGRLCWPAGGRRGPMLIGFGVGPPVSRRLCDEAGALVLDVDPVDAADGALVLDWVGEHGAELGASDDRLLMVGGPAAAVLVCEVAAAASRHGWPPIAAVLVLDDGASAARSSFSSAPRSKSAPVVRRVNEDDLVAAVRRVVLTDSQPRRRTP